ncbi:MAG: BlaI/MecI/CopY family transcriptional regulator [Bacteroidales bacterium]|jgi:predicted transcriptional regulator|nr:BlaI/MecI/CopY family transcriptional regulator [Bacteroidales bacterium]
MQKYKPTDSELEILQILWTEGECTVREIYEKLKDKRNIGYTTTLKTMQIMFEKGILSREKSKRTHLYKAELKKEETERVMVSKLLNSVFEGSAVKLVMRALGSNKTSKEELEKIKDLIDEIEKEGDKQ